MDQGPALIAAILNQEEAKVKLLLDQKANPNYESPTYGMPLHLALRHGNSTSIVESLILAKADIHYRRRGPYLNRTLSLLIDNHGGDGYVCAIKTNALLHHGLSVSTARFTCVVDTDVGMAYST